MAVDAYGRLATDEVDHPTDEDAELRGNGVADGVRDVDCRGARLDDRTVDLEQEVDVGPRRVLGRELDLGVGAKRLPAVPDPAHGLGQGLFP